jgi:hypothetical protein
VLFGARSFGEALYRMAPRDRRELWSAAALPEWIAAQLQDTDLVDPDWCATVIRDRTFKRPRGRTPVQGRRLALRWPQTQIGYRPALLLLERGRVAWGVFSDELDIRRWARPLEAGPSSPLTRLTPEEMLAAMRVGNTRRN